MIVKENIAFKRGSSYGARKYQITGEYVPGQILVLNDSNLFVYEETKEPHIWGYGMGTLSTNYKNRKYASFIFNTKNERTRVGVRPESLVVPNEYDQELIEKAFDDKISQKYLKMVEEKTGLKPFV